MPPWPRRPSTRRLAEAGLVGSGVFLGSLVAAPLLRDDLSPLEDAVSAYAVGPGGGVQTAGFILPGPAFVGLAVALRRGLGTGRAAAVASGLVGVFGISSVLVGLLPTDGADVERTATGEAHARVAAVALASVPLAMPFARAALARRPVLASLRRPTSVLSIAAAAWFAAMVATLGRDAFAVTERGLLVTVHVWLIVVALGLRRADRERRA
jgi:hypothetical protein